MSRQYLNPVTLIRKKRDGGHLSQEEIKFMVDAYTRDEIPDYQMSAFLMAVFLNGMDDSEASAFAHAMLHSGIVVDLGSVPGIKVDKHSTGGVGDKLSLILAPIVAAAGVPVPMISGRGLGHTGGTLDKLESITGFNVNLDLKQYEETIKKHNLVFIGQTEEIAPADKRLYALRDVTATVESIPLIAGSIMSKKLAEGIDALVLDVKHGSGAFIRDTERAIELAQRLFDIGKEFGKETIAYLTDMDQPLGYRIGNWLEVEESVHCLNGDWPDDVREVTLLLSGAMIFLGGKASSVEEGIQLSVEMVESGKALQKLIDIVDEQGGDTGIIRNPETYSKAKEIVDFVSDGEGYITGVDCYKIGMASLELGAGRKEKSQPVDPQAGIILRKKTGEHVNKGEPLAKLHTNKPEQVETAKALLREAFTLGPEKPIARPLVTHVIDKDGKRAFDYADVPSLLRRK